MTRRNLWLFAGVLVGLWFWSAMISAAFGAGVAAGRDGCTWEDVTDNRVM
jgi:hypothetical protein